MLEGSGSTQVEMADGTKRSFEWGPRSLFAIPLNVKHRHFNGSGRERALMVSTTDMPLVMNTFHNERFIFDNDFDFSERAGKESHYTGEGDLVTVKPGNHMWETNFVPDLAAIELKTWGDRGAGGTNIMFVLADGTMHAHISEMPVGTYKKGHRHGPGFHVMCVVGEGFSLLWHDEREGLHPHRLEARRRVPAGRPAVPPALQYEPAAGALSRHRHRRHALSVHDREPPLADRPQARRERRGVDQPQGRRRPDRVRRPGPAHPPHLAGRR